MLGGKSGQAYILVDQMGANARLCLEHLNKSLVRGLLQECHSMVLTNPPLEVAAELINGLNVINTVGCGDVFVGAFAAYLVLGASTQKSLIMASVATGLNATRPRLEAVLSRQPWRQQKNAAAILAS